MKLLFCKNCCSIFNLTKEVKSCGCSANTKGNYLDDCVNAVYSGSHAIPLAFTNSSFYKATLNYNAAKSQTSFDAFTIDHTVKEFKKIE